MTAVLLSRFFLEQRLERTGDAHRGIRREASVESRREIARSQLLRGDKLQAANRFGDDVFLNLDQVGISRGHA